MSRTWPANPLYKIKTDYCKQNNIVVWRIHDHQHARKPDQVVVGELRKVGIIDENAPMQSRVRVIPETTLGALVALIKKNTGAKAIRVVGDPNLKVTRVAVARDSLEGIDVHVLVGDETALPAIGRRLEELPPQARALVVLDVEDEAYGYPLASAAQLEVVKVPVGDPASRADRIIEALRNLRYPAGSCFTWVAAETHVARAVRQYLMSERGIDKRWIKAAGYWRRGAVGTHETITDEE